MGKQSQIVLRSQSQSTIGYNPKVTSLLAPVLGPVQPHQNDPNATPKNFWTGYVEKFAISDSTFDQQFNAFNRFGFSVDPLAQVSGTELPPSLTSFLLSSLLMTVLCCLFHDQMLGVREREKRKVIRPKAVTMVLGRHLNLLKKKYREMS